MTCRVPSPTWWRSGSSACWARSSGSRRRRSVSTAAPAGAASRRPAPLAEREARAARRAAGLARLVSREPPPCAAGGGLRRGERAGRRASRSRRPGSPSAAASTSRTPRSSAWPPARPALSIEGCLVAARDASRDEFPVGDRAWPARPWRDAGCRPCGWAGAGSRASGCSTRWRCSARTRSEEWPAGPPAVRRSCRDTAPGRAGSPRHAVRRFGRCETCLRPAAARRPSTRKHPRDAYVYSPAQSWGQPRHVSAGGTAARRRHPGPLLACRPVATEAEPTGPGGASTVGG